MKKLPKKLSDRILVALTDLEACSRDKDYVIDMDRYHRPFSGKCHVCLAGAVMAKTFGVKKTRLVYMPCVDGELGCQLGELDAIRCGHIFDWHSFQDRGSIRDMSYADRGAWLNHMLDIVGRLQAEGL